MASIESIQLGDIADANLRAIAKRVLQTASLAANRAAAHAADGNAFPLPDSPDALEHLFLRRLNSRPPAMQNFAKEAAIAFVKAPKAVHLAMLGDLAAVRFDKKESVQAQVRALPLPSQLKLKIANGIQIAGPPGTAPLVIATEPPAAAQVPHKHLTFRIHRVRYDDETGGFFSEQFGDDEISLGGTAVNAAVGKTTEIKPFHVGDFNDGDLKDFSPLKAFKIFDATAGTAFPKSYFVTLVLAEVDMGGVSNFVDKLAEIIEREVNEVLLKVIFGDGVVFGAAVGTVVAWCVDRVIDFLTSAWSDDVFPPVTVRLKISGATFGNKVSTPDQIAVFKGHGGQYSLRYDWLLE